jgi:hypothetical protein
LNRTDGENPYQTPSLDAAGVPDAPLSSGWETDGRKVLVARSALLPMVDPFTGGTGETMMLQRISIACLPHWLWTFPVMGAFIGLMADLLEKGGTAGPFALLGALAGWFLGRLARIPLPLVQIEMFLEKPTFRRRVIISRILLVLLLATIATTLANGLLPNGIKWLPFPLFLLWLLGNVLAIAMQRRIRCRKKNGDYFILEGFHPRALLALVEEQERAARRTATHSNIQGAAMHDRRGREIPMD